ncbi:MAG TPA: hypothetical protein VH206_12265 [Xanthobacteraceae bacterium]|jgi:hypothetical protein|nr:hypothetical protein [Xanthobacteraceae bacterium]
MRQNKARKRGRQHRNRAVVALLVLGGGYALAGQHTIALRVVGPSAAQTVASRFPEIAGPDATTAQILIAAVAPRAPGANDRALLNPQPMTPQVMMQQAMLSVTALPQTASALSTVASNQQALVQVASAEVSLSRADIASASPQAPIAAPRVAAVHATTEIKANPPARRANADRPGYMLNEGQIAEIKTRLNLTPDQEDMWPAVEAALRDMRGQPIHTRSLVAAQTAAVDPDSVQGLKSAAVPLILSFSGEQKDEVRTIIQGMGLSQLASQF